MDERIKKLITECDKKDESFLKRRKNIMGYGWFISYAYYVYVDESQQNWRRVSTCLLRKEAFRETISKHLQWISDILNNHMANVYNPTLDLTTYEILTMANKILETSEEDRYKHASLFLGN